MSLYYCDSTKGFYDSEINKTIPEDKIKISKEEHIYLLEQQCKGKKLTLNDNGKPTAKAPVISMNDARAERMEEIRLKRNEKLKELDVEYMKADETQDLTLKSSIAQQKQILRDLPQTFDLNSATTIEELKALWPSELS